MLQNRYMHGYSTAQQQSSPGKCPPMVRWSTSRAWRQWCYTVARSQLGEVWKCAATQRQEEHRVSLSLRFILITPVCRDLKDSWEWYYRSPTGHFSFQYNCEHESNSLNVNQFQSWSIECGFHYTDQSCLLQLFHYRPIFYSKKNLS